MSKSKTSLSELRSHLFDVIERLKASNDPDADQKDKIDIETAKVISDVSKVIVDAAKAEVDALKTIANASVDLSWYKKDTQGILSLTEGEEK